MSFVEEYYKTWPTVFDIVFVEILPLIIIIWICFLILLFICDLLVTSHFSVQNFQGYSCGVLITGIIQK